MLIETVRNDMTAAVKAGDPIIRDLTRTLLGEVDTFKARHGKVEDVDVSRIIKKLLVANSETMSKMQEFHRNGEPRFNILVQENEYLEKLLPSVMSIQEIKDYLKDRNDVVTLVNEGQAIGVAMKSLRGKSVESNDVIAAVKEMRKCLNKLQE